MPTYHNPSGKKAYIMNMYTAPEYRRQGIAIHTLDLLVKGARELGVSQIALEATNMGRPLYEKYRIMYKKQEIEKKVLYIITKSIKYSCTRTDTYNSIYTASNIQEISDIVTGAVNKLAGSAERLMAFVDDKWGCSR